MKIILDENIDDDPIDIENKMRNSNDRKLRKQKLAERRHSIPRTDISGKCCNYNCPAYTFWGNDPGHKHPFTPHCKRYLTNNYFTILNEGKGLIGNTRLPQCIDEFGDGQH